ncbi:uncharacterized protein LOC118181862 [Stegodyphus dumicola]|uniref:uncharacterized protein LOC118181862 n=1 Tax=Stegodyphus dumicola TaxID=202533 RepID=UPI0015B348E2|nr:uncharacterized protein LOC118181862 [Stegodyphus dumicola]
MPEALDDESPEEEQMNEFPVTNIPVRPSSTFSSSSSSNGDSSDSGKGPPDKNDEDNADSGNSFTFHPSSSEFGTPRNSMINSTISSISENVPTYANNTDITFANRRKSTDASITKQRIPSPEDSMYGIDTYSEMADEEKTKLLR